MLNAAVIGCGYWGSHIVRNFSTSDRWNLKYICDIDPQHLKKISGQFPNLLSLNDSKIIFDDNSIDAVAIATPVSSHFELAKTALLSGKHVWVEKPLTLNSEQAIELNNIAAARNLLLHVDHTFIYTPAVRKIKELIDSGTLGKIMYFDSVRINLGLFQHDVNVIWDLAPHDISILEYTTGKKPISVSATGKSFYKYNEKDLASIAYLTVEFEDGSIAHFHVNWMSPVKIRHIIIGGSERMLVFNDMEPLEKLKVYDCGITLSTREEVYETLIQYRTGDMFSPAIKNYEALQSECNHFYNCIVNNIDTDTSGKSGIYVVKILEAADKSLLLGGCPVILK
jgi:predicted dehydrogenase